jgi:uncharacterized membrane protein
MDAPFRAFARSSPIAGNTHDHAPARDPSADAVSPAHHNRRIEAIDAARGCAMVLVCLSHIHQYLAVSAPMLSEVLAIVTRIATPTFLLLSGFIAGFVLRTDAGGKAAITLVDRALFLLIVAHLLMGWERLPDLTAFEWLVLRVTVPDAIGIALILAVLLRRVPAAALVALSVCIFMLSWAIGMTAAAEASWARNAGAVLFHMRNGSVHPYVEFALAPYLAMFLLGMAISGYLHRHLVADDRRVLARRLMFLGGLGITMAVVGVVNWIAFHDLLSTSFDADTLKLLRGTINPTHKWPPSPAYLLFYGGLGVLMAGVLFGGRPGVLVKPVIRRASVIGRASLMCFVVQDWLLFFAPAVLGFEHIASVPFWLVYVSATVLALYALSCAWVRIHGNRFLTVGLKRVARRNAQQRRFTPLPHP